MHDYSGYTDEPSSNLKAVLRSLADELTTAQEEVERKELELQRAKAVLRDITDNRIPAATEGMDGVLDLGDGRRLEIKEEIRASIAGDKKYPAIRWLDDNGYGNIVKRKLEIFFDKTEQDKVQAVINALKKSGFDFPMKEDYSIHWKTLESWVRERLGEGDSLPSETFGIYRQRSAKVKE